ncbi:MAG: asparaginase [Lachnospiraceae bacterium]|jgi:L-asparaginase|nr:asparaginase [Lachnospiraceae bacterium]
MKKILMIGTGGTIASVSTEDGLRPGLSTEEVLEYIPSIKHKVFIETKTISDIDSSNIRPDHWIMMANAVKENYDKYDGFVICHGTDTLAYTASALSYLIQNNEKPIVVTGAQKPINLEVTDAKTNLYDSFLYAADDNSSGVSIVFDGKVILGTRAKKESSKSFNAFASVNYPYLAVIIDDKIIRYIPKQEYNEPVIFYDELFDKIGYLKLFPGIDPELFKHVFDSYDSIVIESFGVGGLPDYIRDVLYSRIADAKNRDKLFVMATQVVNEGSNMTVYEVGRKVKLDFNFLETYDMTLEATITKLMWILGNFPHKFSITKELFYSTIANDVLNV